MSNEQDPFFEEEPRSVAARLLPPLVLICAFGGFVALAIYAYKAGSQSVNEGELMVIEADKTPVKEKPEDPGGMQFPNQDKTIFNTITSGGQIPPAVERVLPAPEEPIAKDGAPANWANEQLAAATPAVPQGAEQLFGEEPAPAQQPNAVQEPSVAQTGPVVVNVREELGKQAVADAPAPAAPVTILPQASAEKVTVNEGEAKEVKSAFAPPQAEPKPAVKPAAKPTTKSQAAGKQLVQLGAFRSEAEAKSAFVKAQKKHVSLTGKSPVINRADLGDKGVFYRLRVATDDAKKLCATLSAGGQACMAVK